MNSMDFEKKLLNTRALKPSAELFREIEKQVWAAVPVSSRRGTLRHEWPVWLPALISAAVLILVLWKPWREDQSDNARRSLSGFSARKDNPDKAPVETGDIVAMFRGGPNHSGYFQGALGQAKLGSKPIQLLFVCHGEKIKAIDPASGKELWSVDCDGDLWREPVPHEGRLYFGSMKGTFYCLNAKTGEEVWTKKFVSAIESSPAVAKDCVYAGDCGGNLTALKTESGDILWTVNLRTEAPNFENQSVCATPVVTKELLYISSYDGNVYCLDRKEGKTIWKKAVENLHYASPVLADNVLYVNSGRGSEGAIVALDVNDKGNILWSHKTFGCGYSSPAFQDGVVYCGSGMAGDANGELYAIDAKTGELKWSFRSNMGGFWSSPSVKGKELYLGAAESGSGGLLVLDLETGREIRRFVSGPVMGSTVVGKGFSIFGSGDSDSGLYCFEIASGKILWSLSPVSKNQDSVLITLADEK